MRKFALAMAAVLLLSVLAIPAFAAEAGASLGDVPQSYADITVVAVKREI